MFEDLVEVSELVTRLDDGDWVIVDCRYDLSDTAKGYAQYLQGHIPRAIFADLHDDLSGPPATDRGRHPLPEPARLLNLFSAMGIDSKCQVIAYDASGGAFAARVWWMLRYMGHRAAAVLNGGWQAWERAGAPVVMEPERRTARDFQGAPRRTWLVTVDQVLDHPRIVDSREPARYLGDEEPIDAVAGHIPGAVNYHWQRNLGTDGCFLPGARIRRQLDEILDHVPSQDAVFYCGSGVSACHNLLAASIAGLAPPRLYVGSWSEWCSDPARPVARGAD